MICYKPKFLRTKKSKFLRTKKAKFLRTGRKVLRKVLKNFHGTSEGTSETLCCATFPLDLTRCCETGACGWRSLVPPPRQSRWLTGGLLQLPQLLRAGNCIVKLVLLRHQFSKVSPVLAFLRLVVSSSQKQFLKVKVLDAEKKHLLKNIQKAS